MDRITVITLGISLAILSLAVWGFIAAPTKDPLENCICLTDYNINNIKESRDN